MQTKIKIALVILGLTASSCQKKGPQGVAGKNGANGGGCSVTQIEPSEAAPNGGAVILCAGGTQAIIHNGANGHDGVDSIIEVITPCPDLVGAHREVLLRLADGTLLAFYEGGPHKGRLSLLEANTTYQLTDGSGCQFTVNHNLEVVY
jgi:hypothetical protein